VLTIRSAAVLEHGRDLVLHPQPDALEVDRDDLVEVLLRGSADRLLQLDAGVVVREVQAPERRDRPRDRGPAVGLDADVAGKELRVSPLLLDEPYGLHAVVAARLQIAHEDAGRALARQRDRGRPPDAARGARDQPGLALDQTRHPRSSPVS
jgi:hypothetical protein